MKILIVEDDETLAALIRTFMHAKGYETCVTGSGEEALQIIPAEKPDLILLDIMMPGIDGRQVLAELRKTWQTPVLFITALGQQEDIIEGLRLGADDYLTKPVDLTELELRVAAVLRRSQPAAAPEPEIFDDEYLRVDLDRHAVAAGGNPIRLTPTEFRLLAYLIANRDRAVPHAELLREVWGPAYVEDVANLQVYIRYLREKLEEDPRQPRYIATAWGIGYRFARGTPDPGA